MLSDSDICSLAACLALAKKLDPNGDSLDAEWYWHTREAIFELLERRKGGEQVRCRLWSDVLLSSKNFEWEIYADAARSAASAFWAEVGPPEVIVREVLGS